MQDYLETATQLAREAGELIRSKVDDLLDVQHKGAIDLVTESDLAAEKLITEGILQRYPDHAILGEEGGALGNQDSEHRWIIDPIDGTTNYAHGLRQFCVCIGLEIAKAPSVGVVYDPMADELFTAVRGEGAFLNGKPIRVSATTELRQAVLCTGFAYDVHTNPDNNLDRFCAFIKRAQAVRRFGSAGLDLCYTACGRFDGFWETFLSPWDMCAGLVILREAGATITNFGGGEHSMYEGTTLISNGHLHEAMVEVLGNAGPHSFAEVVAGEGA